MMYHDMRIRSFDWDKHNMAHVGKHHVDTDEVEEVFEGRHHLFRTGDGRCGVLGRSGAGRQLFVVFEHHGQGTARVVTARDMTSPEKKLYRRKVER